MSHVSVYSDKEESNELNFSSEPNHASKQNIWAVSLAHYKKGSHIADNLNLPLSMSAFNDSV